MVLENRHKVFVPICSPTNRYSLHVLCREGQYSRLPELPYTPGSDAAGYVQQLGRNVTTLKVSQVLASGVGGFILFKFKLINSDRLETGCL